MLISDDDLKQLLLKNQITTEAEIVKVEKYIKNSDVSFIDAIIERNILTDENLHLLIADYLKLPFIVLSKISIPDEVVHILPERLARKHMMVVFARDVDGIKVATIDPKNVSIQDVIEKKTGQKVTLYFASERDIENALKMYKKDLQKTFDRLLQDVMRSGNVLDTPITKVVDILVSYAYENRTSDIHIEPQETVSLVRFRMDGVLHDVLTLPKNLHDRVITRIKVLSKLRTDEHLSAQDGKMRMMMEDGSSLDIRVSILPIVDGEKAVLRLLSSQMNRYSLATLGMNEFDLKKVTNAVSKSYGMILSTGPTGSGKSTSIYILLKILNSREKNITTVEDPVEYRIKGVNQIPVNAKTGLTFAAGLRSILRQDPNIIFVGEIRDTETAGIAVNAALTGHLVLSTLHTNDAATTLPRLTDMHIEPFLVASTVNVIIAQRLLRKTCEMCKASIQITYEDMAKQIPKEYMEKYFKDKQAITIFKGTGCTICHHTGYSGRIGIFEVLEVTKTIRQMITEKADSDQITKQALAEGMTTMFEDGLQKILTGLTTLEEVLRVTKA